MSPDWSKGRRRRIARMGVVCAACLFVSVVAAAALLVVDVFLSCVVFGAGLTVASLVLALTLVAVEIPPSPVRARVSPKLVARCDESRSTLRIAEQRAGLLARATDRRSRRELDVLRRLIARVYAQQALLLASMGDAHRLRVVVVELREELMATARTVMADAPVRPPLQR